MVLLLASMVLAVATAAPVHDTTQSDRAAVTRAEVERNGAKTHLHSIVFSGHHAIVHGNAGTLAIHDILKNDQGRWSILCGLGVEAVTVDHIVHHCGLPQSEAAQLVYGEGAGDAAERGEFSNAAAQERSLYQISTPEMRPSETARIQFLDQIKRQMDTGQMTRSQAITKWNEFRLTTFVP